MRDQMAGSSIDERIGLIVIICAYGRDDLTLQTLTDLGQSGIGHKVCIVDNQGSFTPPVGNKVQVIRPSSNLGWAGGSNLGLHSMIAQTDAQLFVLLNNDVRLSHGFVDGLYEAWQQTDGAVIGPAYDHNWPHQRISYTGHPSDYRPGPIERLVPFIDGTCMLISRKAVDTIGFLDGKHWPDWGWGCDKDFCLRARSAGGRVFVTERSYLSHSARGTAALMPDFSEAKAEAENDAGMTVKWGTDWRDRLYEGFDNHSRAGIVQERIREDSSRNPEPNNQNPPQQRL
jgi:GT2 family glycosyltransferase